MNIKVKAHKNQVRKNEPEKPMIIHPISVAKLLEYYGCDDNVVAAGYLHDVVEDTKYTLDDIQNIFGDDIANLVDVASEPDKTLSWEERKQHTIDNTKHLPLRKKLVICADKINNAEDMALKFERVGHRSFSKFKRGEESQRWYYENIYASLIYNEDENLPIFKRLKSAIDTVFNPKKNELLDSIFEGDQVYYSSLRRLDAAKRELYNLKQLSFLDRPFTVEFCGVPRTGKTTIINNVYDFFKKGGFDVTLIPELTTSEYYKKSFYKTIETLPKYELNLEIFLETKRQLESAISKGSDIILIDRSLCDRLVWMYRLVSKKTIDTSTFNCFLKQNISSIRELIDVLIVTYTDSLTSLKRDYTNSLALEDRRFLNQQNIDEYSNALNFLEETFECETDSLQIDTTNISTRDTSVIVADKIMTKMRKSYLDNFKNKYK